MSAEPTTDGDPRGNERLALVSGFAGAASKSTCATCRRPLIDRPSGAVCVYCLADFLIVEDDGLQSGQNAEEQNPKAWWYGHFEIFTDAAGLPVELGRGAMGIAYRARDTVLNRVVALKVIDRRLAEHPAARSRFLREARAAARFHHPNVASVLHYGEEDGECFYAMELVAGETLAERVHREGPLPAGLALEIAFQIARGLAAAEAQGIVHRDLKPGNVMLDAVGSEGGGRASLTVKVIDFGLAKAVTASEGDGLEDTRGGFAGTPAFASPEQFAPSENGRIDTRSDIYSLGVTLWYLLSGKLPFLGQTLDEIHEQQTRQPLPWDQLSVARVPKPILTLLRFMLSAAPSSRPQSARELLAALEKCRRALPPSPQVLRRRRLRLLGGALTLAALAAGWLYHATRPPPDRSVAVLPFENRSADPANGFFATGVRDQITVDLAHIGQLKVIGTDSANDYPPDKPRDFASIGRTLGVRYLLTGSLQRQGDKFEVGVCLTDSHDPAHPWTGEYIRSSPEIFAVQGEITRAVANRLQASLTPEEKAAVNRPPTTSLAAYDLYLQATAPGGEFTSDEPFRADLQRRIDLLAQAIAIDPKFVLAYCVAARAHDTIDYYRTNMTPEELSVDHRGLAEVCLARAQQIQPDSGDVHYALAFHDFRVIHDNEQATREITLAQRTLPNNADVAALAGRLAVRQSRWDDAVASLRRAVELDPRDTEKLQMLCLIYQALRRYPEWERTYRRYDQLVSPSTGLATFPLKHALIELERTADLEPLRAVLAPPGPHSANETICVLLDFYAGDADALARLLSTTRETEYVLNGYVYPKEWYEAMAALIRGDKNSVRAALTAGRPKFEQAIRDQPKAGIPLGLLAMADALLGNTEDAVREARRACELTAFETGGLEAPIVRCDLAVVYAWTNQADRAFAELGPLVALPVEGIFVPDQPTYGDFRLNPLWQPLRADPRFKAIEKRLAPATRK